ncbi:hypothetical protein MMC17_004318 [Xylographa soralifera]|nr:hypothetical protein [Xylographa soralifera]
MLEGEFISITTIEAVVPGLTPETVGSGNFLKNPEIYFMVVEFLELSQDVPDSDKFTDLVIKMHLQGISPNGMFGFSIPTCDGPLAHPVKWEISWVEFFARLLRSGITTDATACGTWAALESAAEQVISKVIPRLLGTLRFEGEPIKPSLIHGDLWDTNIGLDSKTGRIVVYDAGSYYAHNEMELEIWRVIYAEKLGASEYREAYLRKYPPAEPVAEWDDRNRLYSLKYNLNCAYNGMCYLCEKIAPLQGIGRYDPKEDPAFKRG